MNYQEALESQKGAQFFKSTNNSLDFKHNIAEHFFYLGQKSEKEKLEQLKAENKILKDALEFYADKKNYTNDKVCFHVEQVGFDDYGNPDWHQYQDGGGLAIQALEKIK